MKTAPAALPAIVLALLIAPGLVLAQHDHAMHAAHAGPSDLAAPAEIPSGHVRWTPDAPLVAGMGQVRRAVATLAHLEMGHLDEGQVLTLAGDVDAAIESMFANCRLEPEPDVALHGILARLMAGSKALRDAPTDPAPVGPMRDAVADYERLFDDPAAAAGR